MKPSNEAVSNAQTLTWLSSTCERATKSWRASATLKSAKLSFVSSLRFSKIPAHRSSPQTKWVKKSMNNSRNNSKTMASHKTRITWISRLLEVSRRKHLSFIINSIETRVTKEDKAVVGEWKAWDNSGCPASRSERTRDCIINNNQEKVVPNEDCLANAPEGTLFVDDRECCTDRENYSEEDEKGCECMYPWSADANGDCNTCTALRPMQFLCYICKYCLIFNY